jgi:hypothetical protein
MLIDEGRRLVVARRLVEAGRALRVFQVKDDYCPSHATLQAMRESETAFSAGDYDNAEHLADVVLRMARRDTIKFQANPEAWIAKLQFVSGEVTA